jgi:hypothetical protein
LKPLADLSALRSKKKFKFAAEHAQSEFSEIYRIKQVLHDDFASHFSDNYFSLLLMNAEGVPNLSTDQTLWV